MRETYDWTMFRDSEIYTNILEKWSSLLENENALENDYHKFLQNHPSIFLTSLDSFLVISKLKLGSDYETDFVVVNEGYSNGTEYELIEIESPHTKLFNKNGIPSAKFNAALQQIRDWKRWLIDNKSQFKKIFPTQNTKVIKDSKLKFKIIIGRRDNDIQSLEKRKQIEEENNIEIISFDRLTDLVINRKYFFNESSIFSSQMDNISYDKKNELANPFYECIKDSDWRKICSKGHAHIYSSLIDEILRLRTYNSDFANYKKYKLI